MPRIHPLLFTFVPVRSQEDLLDLDDGASTRRNVPVQLFGDGMHPPIEGWDAPRQGRVQPRLERTIQGKELGRTGTDTCDQAGEFYRDSLSLVAGSAPTLVLGPELRRV